MREGATGPFRRAFQAEKAKAKAPRLGKGLRGATRRGQVGGGDHVAWRPKASVLLREMATESL